MLLRDASCPSCHWRGEVLGVEPCPECGGPTVHDAISFRPTQNLEFGFERTRSFDALRVEEDCFSFSVIATSSYRREPRYLLGFDLTPMALAGGRGRWAMKEPVRQMTKHWSY